MPKFSIVVPVYNVSRYVADCLDSLRRQSFVDWEAICVDDGSTDGSGAILDAFQQKDSRFRVVHQANGGLSVARNTGLDLALGEYVGFLDGDDAIAEDWLQHAADLAGKTHADLIRQRFTFFNDGQVFPSVSAVGDYAFYSTYETMSSWGWTNLLVGGWVWLIFFKRELIKSRFVPRVQLLEDVLFDIDMIRCCKTACQGEYCGYLYRMREGSICHKTIDLVDTENVLRELIVRCSEADIRVVDPSITTRAIFMQFYNWLTKGDRRTRWRDRELRNLLKLAIDKRLVCLAALEFRWRIPMWIFIKVNSFIMFYFLENILDCYRCVRYGRRANQI